MANAMISWEDAELPMLDESGLAAWLRDQGQSVVEAHDRYWTRIKLGFYQPIHVMAGFRRAEAVRPTSACWGFRVRLAPSDATAANATIPAHMLPDVAGYDIGRLAPERRRFIRKALREVDHVAMTAPDILVEQGYRIYEEAHAHQRDIPLPDPATFRRWMESYFAAPRGLILAAMRHGRLLGFNLNFAVDGTAYQQWIVVGEEGRSHRLAMSLFHLLAETARRSPGVVELMNGQHLRENPGLDEFKRRQGLEVVQVPARAWIAPPVGAILRRTFPHKHYRVIGDPRPGDHAAAASTVPSGLAG